MTESSPGQFPPVTKTTKLVTHLAAQPGKSVTIANRNGEEVDVAFLLGRALQQIQDLVNYRDRLCKEVFLLEQLPRINARPYWRQGKYLYLIYPQVNGERQRHYVGSNQEDIDRCLRAIANHERQVKLKQQVEDLDKDLRSILRQVEEVDGISRMMCDHLIGDTPELPAAPGCHQ